MSNQSFNILEINTYDTTGYYANVLGREQEHRDIDYSVRPIKPLSDMPIKSRIVKNTDSVVLPKGVCCKWDAYGYGTLVVKAGDGDVPAGFVPYYVPASIPLLAIFAMIFDGPCTMLNSADSAISGAAGGDKLVTAATGYVKKQTAAPSDSTAAMVQVNSRCGTAIANAPTDPAGYAFRGIAQCRTR
jgi:hypothetical protein